MSEQPTTGNTSDEIPGLDQTLDPAERQTRISMDETDDLPVTLPDQQPRTPEQDPADLSGGSETIEERISQEVPDPNSAYGAPENESGLDGAGSVGGDDPDAIPEDRDFVGGGRPADEPVDAPAEEAALHIEGDSPA